MDKEFAEAFKEEIELDEMNWAVGGVYHQEFKNGDRVYFRADSVQKNKRWKGLSVDEFGGRQKKAKSASADEKQQGWETTPKNEIPKGLKEEVELDEEIADITIQKDVGKMKINQVALKVMTNARRFGLKSSLLGNNVRISGPKKKVNDYLDVVIGRSSSGDATQKGPSNPQIDKMLT
ncbi:uncharacterized protein METZ01_LOCUS429316, partial [marine metagenome]